ncbi:MORN repeat-containing protein 3-like [Musca vetustissima]|uniref:MORN repeat-containing protein 3-like n=1 Tax=Musca vetustissima TaxID=27455 RepID=UPI002AB6C0E0|nr:MORN repeat-containing protein 3-like [Musca vetustissima]
MASKYYHEQLCEKYNNPSKSECNGWRSTFYYPGGGNYRGYWSRSQHHRFGVKESKSHLIYDGQWKEGKRHGWGMMRRRLQNGTMERIYAGQWQNDKKCGEGKQFYADGSIYYGWWLDNRRHGLGIQWYGSGEIYLGEWQVDVRHGLGVMFYANGNRYEGYFARGFKNGEGTFYHMLSGQIQKGIWQDDICKVSMLQDEFRQQTHKPTPYPIPLLRLACPTEFIRKLFADYNDRVKISCNSPKFVEKFRMHIKLEPKAMTKSKFVLDDLDVPCTCKMREKLIQLREL